MYDRHMHTPAHTTWPSKPYTQCSASKETEYISSVRRELRHEAATLLRLRGSVLLEVLTFASCLVMKSTKPKPR